MGEFYGSLQDIGLPEILSFLRSLGKTGTLRISQGRWTGEASLNGGRVTGASFNNEEGVAALQGIMLGLGAGSFTFTDGSPSDQNIDLEPDELQARLGAFADERDQLVAAVPSLGAVPRVAKAPGTSGEVVLDGAAIEALLAVNGERTVGEIAREHGLVQTARDLGKLLVNGLITLDVPEGEAVPARSQAPALPVAPETVIREKPSPADEQHAVAAAEAPGSSPAASSVSGPPAPASLDQPAGPSRVGATESAEPPTSARREPAPGGEPKHETPPPMPAVASASVVATDLPSESARTEMGAGDAVSAEPVAAEREEIPLAESGPCPKLGYVDDPANRYSRPTQLHRCFASGVAERVSTPEQRDLCLTNRYPTCPRFIAAGATAPPAASPVAAPAEAQRQPVEAGSVRGRVQAPPLRDLTNGGSSRSLPARPLSPVSARATDAIVRPNARPPSPVREPVPAAVAEERAAPESESVRAEMPPAVEPRAPAVNGRPIAVSPPAARRLVPAVLLVTAVAVATLAVIILRASNPGVPEVTDEEVARLATSVANIPSAPAPVPGQPAPGAPGSSAQPARTALDIRFSESPADWPSNPSSTAWFADGKYHVYARTPGQFVAIGAPTAERFGDMTVSATFRKVDGPIGGGYGFIIRDQGPGPRDGVNQIGQYYVLEVGDRGEYGIWRREGDRWLDLIPWTQSDLVPQGDATNEVTVQATGQELTFLINGKVLANLVGAVLRDGGVGIFVGGDLNEVVVDHFVVQTPT